MDNLMRKLPIGIQTFEGIRKDNYLYVDKTALVWRMANLGKPYFLSRPRRFGKSLLISTFDAYFQGKKELFDGLAIEQLETKWEQHPVLHLDLNAKKYETAADLIAMLNQYLEKWEAIYGNEKKDRSPEERFSYVIEQASLKIRQTAFAGYYPSEIIRRLSSDIKSLLWSTKKRRRISPFCFPDRSYEVLTSQRIQRFESVE